MIRVGFHGVSFSSLRAAPEIKYHGRRIIALDLHAKLVLQDCPFCGGAGLLEEENNWCWYVMCMDCGAQTAAMEFRTVEEREEAAQMAAHLWNIGKVVRGDIGE